MASIFSRIIAGDIPAHRILEDDRFLAFLDIMPLAEGHTLVIPKVEVDYLFDLDDDILHDILPFSRKVAAALSKTVPCARVGLSVIGLEVPHAHVHLVPLNSMDDLNFTRPKLQMEQGELAALASRIRQNLPG